MQGPINYNIDVKNPFEEYAKGLQLGNGIRQMQNQQAQEAQMAAELQALSENPSTEGLLKFSIRNPEKAALMAPAFKQMSESDLNRSRAQMGPVFHALSVAKQPAIAAQVLRQQAAALKNSGREEDAAAAMATADDIEAGGDRLKMATNKVNVGALNIYGADEFAKLAKLPEELLKGEAEATKSGVEAEFIRSDKLLAQEKTNSDISKTNFDKVVANRKLLIDGLTYKLNESKNTLEREKLQRDIDNAKREQELALSDRMAEGKGSISSIESLQESLKQISDIPESELDWAAGTISNAPFNPVKLGADSTKMRKLIELTNNKAALVQLQKMRGFGSLSNGDREFITNSAESLSLDLDAKTLKNNAANLGRITKELLKVEQQKYGIKDPVLPPKSSGKPPPIKVKF